MIRMVSWFHGEQWGGGVGVSRKLVSPSVSAERDVVYDPRAVLEALGYGVRDSSWNA